MKYAKSLTAILLAGVFLAGPFATAAAENTSTEKIKTYPLQKCIVSDEKLGEMGKPYVFNYEGQEIKLCCKSCKKDFDKNPKKYLKKLEAPKKRSS